jgi:hypothetical protein
MEQQPEKSLERKYAFSSVPMYEHKTPEFIENNGEQFIINGTNNEYPDYLTYLYNRCGLHHAIVNGKVRFINGQGWTIKNGFESAELRQLLANPNPNDSFDELMRKAIIDSKIFGGYYLKLLFVGGKLMSVFHQPYEQVRLSVSGQIYYVSKEWTRNQSTKKNFKSKFNQLPKDVKAIKPFDPKQKDGVQLVYFPDYRPEFRGYPLPEYHASIVDIETDIEVSNFHLVNVKTGFSAGAMITLMGGVPSPKEQDEIERKFYDKFCNTDNAGQIMIQFADLNTEAPKIESIKPTDLDKQFESLKNDVQDRIIRGHEVINGMLFGIKTEGQLGGRSEIDLAWQMLNLNYIEPNQQRYEKEINWVLKECGLSPVLRIEPLKGLGIEITDGMLMASLTRDEMRNLIEGQFNIGLNKVVKKTSDSAAEVTEAINSLSPLVANKVIASMTANEIRALVGLPPEQGGEQLAPEVATPPTEAFKKKSLDANMDSIILSKFAMIGLSADKFEFASDEDALLKYIIDKNLKKLDINRAKKDLDFDVNKALQKLIEKNLVAGQLAGTEAAPKFDIKDVVEPETLIEFETRWQYAWIDKSLENNTSEGIDKSRTFCKDLLALNKTYTREEIDGLNNDMADYNTNVWKYKGGWYHNPQFDQNFPQCRHFWKAVIVRKK